MMKPLPPSLLLRTSKNFLLKAYLQEEGKPMPKYVTVAAHLSLDELAHRYRKAVDTVERSHFHIIWRRSQVKRVGERVGLAQATWILLAYPSSSSSTSAVQERQEAWKRELPELRETHSANPSTSGS